MKNYLPWSSSTYRMCWLYLLDYPACGEIWCCGSTSHLPTESSGIHQTERPNFCSLHSCRLIQSFPWEKDPCTLGGKGYVGSLVNHRGFLQSALCWWGWYKEGCCRTRDRASLHTRNGPGGISIYFGARLTWFLRVQEPMIPPQKFTIDNRPIMPQDIAIVATSSRLNGSLVECTAGW